MPAPLAGKSLPFASANCTLGIALPGIVCANKEGVAQEKKKMKRYLFIRRID
jgi:hypothetical protein